MKPRTPAYPQRSMSTVTVDTIEAKIDPASAYRFVATPANWSRFHPMTRSVSPMVTSPAGIGTEFVEHAQFGTGRFAPALGDLSWRVTTAEAGVRWVIRTALAGGLEADIEYCFFPVAPGRTQVQRTMRLTDSLLVGVGWRLLRRPVAHQCTRAVARLQEVLEEQANAAD